MNRNEFDRTLARKQRRLIDDDDGQGHWQSLGDVLRKVLEKAERAWQENHKPKDPA